jgi:hypothetical protein
MGYLVSATKLLDRLERTQEYFENTRLDSLNEGAERVLGKLTEGRCKKGYRRVYVRRDTDVFAMWDLLSETELHELGYRATDQIGYQFRDVPSVERDRIRPWVSDHRRSPEMWVGEPLTT